MNANVSRHRLYRFYEPRTTRMQLEKIYTDIERWLQSISLSNDRLSKVLSLVTYWMN